MTPAAPAPTTAATLSTVSAWAQPDELAQDAGPQRLSIWFGVTGLLLLATLLAAVFVQARQYTLLNTTVRVQGDYLVLGLYQVETEYLRLREQLRKEVDAPGSSALQLRYDIFISRISMLGSERARRLIGEFNSEARPQSDAPGVLQALDSFTRRADLYLGSETRATLSPQAAKVLLADLETLDAPIHDVLQNASHRVAAQVTERQAKVRNHNQIGLALTGFLLAMVAVFASIALRQMRKLEHRRSRLEALADQLRDARIEAEAASDLKSEFLADMSHELRTPLHGLLGMLTLLRESPRDTHAAAWLLTADESAQHLRRLLDDILDLSKLNSGSLTLLPTPVDLLALLRETRSLLLPAASAKGLSLRIEIDPTLGAQAQLDATRVRQVLFNLLSNAIKFTDAGSIILKCQRLQSEPDGPELLAFNVSDSGVGMDRETLARLFQRRSRSVEGRSARLGGAGLGLAISRNLARLMDGEIVVSSSPGAGSVFSFRCPLHRVAGAAAPVLPSQSASTRPLHVLVAEDHPINRMYLAALLTRLGHLAVLVDDGLQALQAVQARASDTSGAPAFDLVLMDVHMPVMDGVAATSAIRALASPASLVCIAAITADVFADTLQRCQEAGVNEVLSKPLSLEGLRTVLANRFGNQHLQPAGSTTSTQAGLPLPSAPRTEATCHLLDHATLQGVTDLMDSLQLSRMYGDFFVQAEGAARRMREAMRDADTEALRLCAHTVKGAALHLGLPALAEASALLNREAGTLAAAHLALAVQRFEEITAATRALCAGEGLLTGTGSD